MRSTFNIFNEQSESGREGHRERNQKFNRSTSSTAVVFVRCDECVLFCSLVLCGLSNPHLNVMTNHCQGNVNRINNTDIHHPTNGEQRNDSNLITTKMYKSAFFSPFSFVQIFFCCSFENQLAQLIKMTKCDILFVFFFIIVIILLLSFSLVHRRTSKSQLKFGQYLMTVQNNKNFYVIFFSSA